MGKTLDIAIKSIIGIPLLALAGLLGTAGYAAVGGFQSDAVTAQPDDVYKARIISIAKEARQGFWGLKSLRVEFDAVRGGSAELLDDGVCKLSAPASDLKTQKGFILNMAGGQWVPNTIPTPAAFAEYITWHELGHCGDQAQAGRADRPTWVREMVAEVYGSVRFIKAAGKLQNEAVAIVHTKSAFRAMQAYYGLVGNRTSKDFATDVEWKTAQAVSKVALTHWTTPALHVALDDVAAKPEMLKWNDAEILAYAQATAENVFATYQQAGYLDHRGNPNPGNAAVVSVLQQTAYSNMVAYGTYTSTQVASR